jgi:uncharacterized membrane protein YjjP (DUF1212 family)
VARVVLRVGCILIESGITARRTQEAIRKAALGFGCPKIEMMCGADMIAVELRREEERATELRRVRPTRVNMQLAYATLEVVDRIAQEGLSPETVQAEFDSLRAAPREHPHWLICLAAVSPPAFPAPPLDNSSEPTPSLLCRPWSHRLPVNGCGCDLRGRR